MNLKESELTDKIKEGNFDYSVQVFKGYTERAIQVVKNMLKVDPAIRITADEIEDSAWVHGLILPVPCFGLIATGFQDAKETTKRTFLT